jgi:threonine aldolase
MRRAMAEADVGDDVFGEDPTVRKLEAITAEIAGKESSLFVPSGTMGNACAICSWVVSGDEIILEEKSHTFRYEAAHIATVSRVLAHPVTTEKGIMDPGVIRNLIREGDLHQPRTSLICLENTHNLWGGRIVPLENMKRIFELARKRHLKVHLDGARIFNASAATGISVREYASCADSIMFCLSKGLAAPAGSLIAGPRDFIERARRVRKMLGGGMRQVGVLAAPGIVALTQMTERLSDDHRRARTLAEGISMHTQVDLDPEDVETNMIYFRWNSRSVPLQTFITELQDRGILLLALDTDTVRMVTHKDIDDTDIERTIQVFRSLLENRDNVVS